MPGFIDGHAHLMQLGAQAVGANLLPSPDGKADNIDALIGELKVFASSPDVAQTGWIFGMGYDDSILGRHPTKDDLDRVSTTVPVSIIHISGHFSVMNSVGLAKAGITAESKDPVGGKIGRMPGSRPCSPSVRPPRKGKTTASSARSSSPKALAKPPSTKAG